MSNFTVAHAHGRFMGHGEPDTKKVEHTVGNLRKTLDYYEELLQNQSYLAGNVS